MTAPARVAALQALLAIDGGRLDLPGALAATRARLDDPRDRALCADIVHGTLRWQRALDHWLAALARTGSPPADSHVRAILRLSLYQLVHLDRVPASAVVNDAVSLTRVVNRARSAGFVNASLRGFLRRRRHMPLPARPEAGDDETEARAYLGVAQSHPAWLVERWLARYGYEATDAWLRFNNETPAITLRANPVVNTRDELAAWLEAQGVRTHPTRWARDGLVVDEMETPQAVVTPTPRFIVQDEASQIVADLMAASPGERVLDLCAAPGGKTAAMAGQMRDEGLLVACDVRAKRVRLLRSTLAATGATNTRVVRVGATGPLPFRAPFDAVLVDAPCSGVGTLRRDPDLKWRRQEADVSPLATAQQALLARAACWVRPGGRLVYATCSSEPDENERVVESFLATHEDFAIDRRVPTALPHYTTLFDPEGWLHTLPFRDGLDAFFAAPLRRLDDGRSSCADGAQ